MIKRRNESSKWNEFRDMIDVGEDGFLVRDIDSPSSEDVVSARESLSSEERCSNVEFLDEAFCSLLEGREFKTDNS